MNLLAQILTVLLDIRALLRLMSAPQLSETEELLDNCDAKRMLKIGDRTLYRWRKQNLIRYRMIGNKCYYFKSDLDKLKAKN